MHTLIFVIIVGVCLSGVCLYDDGGKGGKGGGNGDDDNDAGFVVVDSLMLSHFDVNPLLKFS